MSQKLDLDMMKPIKTRLTTVFRMQPLDEKENRDFISFRLQNAEAPKDLIDSEAMSIIASNCRGNRRQIMNVGTLVMEEACYRREKMIGSQLLLSCDLFDISG